MGKAEVINIRVMTQAILESEVENTDVERLQKAYDNLARELELHYKKGQILKEELDTAINHEQIKIVLNKISKIKD